MAELTQKSHFCFNLHHETIRWNRATEIRPDDTRMTLFRHRMSRIETELTKEKFKIESIKKSLWDYYKKLVNPYEYIHLNKTVSGVITSPIATIPNAHTATPISIGFALGTHGMGIANHEPISRAYFKMWEILHDFPIVSRERRPIRYAALAEGPGGFIEAFIHFRRAKAFGVPLESMLSAIATTGTTSGSSGTSGSPTSHVLNQSVQHNPYNDAVSSSEYPDEIIAITLCDDKKVQIPGWKRSSAFLDSYKSQITVSFGADGTGNLYSKENIEHYCALFKDNHADIATADGGFDFSDNYSQQENTLYRLLLAEVIVGLRVLRWGGCMVIKVFDFMSDYTIEILYLITSLFRNVYITKPCTSRIMNSEKYIVACGYMEFTELPSIPTDTVRNYMIVRQVEILRRMYMQFDTLTDEQPTPTKTILQENTIPPSFIEALEQCNIGFGLRQLTSLVKTFDLVERQVDSDTINHLKKDQCVYAMAWCKKYEFPIYFRSKVIREIDTYHYIPIF